MSKKESILKVIFNGIFLGLLLSLTIFYIKGNSMDSLELFNITTLFFSFSLVELVLFKFGIISQSYSKMFVKHNNKASKVLEIFSALLYFNLMFIAFRHYTIPNINENNFALINVFIFCLTNIVIQQIENKNQKLIVVS